MHNHPDFDFCEIQLSCLFPILVECVRQTGILRPPNTVVTFTMQLILHLYKYFTPKIRPVSLIYALQVGKKHTPDKNMLLFSQFLGECGNKRKFLYNEKELQFPIFSA